MSRRPPPPGGENSLGSIPTDFMKQPRSSQPPVSKAICGMSPSPWLLGRRLIPAGTGLSLHAVIDERNVGGGRHVLESEVASRVGRRGGHEVADGDVARVARMRARGDGR